MTGMTAIEWTDLTLNWWEGCQKVGPGCDHCYAEARDQRFTGGEHWGPGAPRRKVKGAPAKLRKIQREAGAFHAEHGRNPRVFCSSLADVFDNAVPDEWRREFLVAITVAPNCRFQLLTKRVGNVEKMIPPTWKDGWPHWVGLMITVVNQEEADRDIPKLLTLKAKYGIPWVGLSMEPLLGPVDLTCIALQGEAEGFHFNSLNGKWIDMDPGTPEWIPLDWVIVGGESGPNARPMHPDWARSIRDQCEAAGTPFLFKQWGEWCPDPFIDGPQPDLWMSWDGTTIDGGISDVAAVDCDKPVSLVVRMGKKHAGRLLDGIEHNGFPGALS